MGGHQGIASDLRSHLAITQDEVREDGEHRATRGALDTPDGETTQPDTDIMGVAGQTPAATTGGRMFELKPKGQDERHQQFETRLAVSKYLKVIIFILKIDGDSPVFSRRFGPCTHVSPLWHEVSSAEKTRWGQRIEISRPS
jgi:hypothetical protein